MAYKALLIGFGDFSELNQGLVALESPGNNEKLIRAMLTKVYARATAFEENSITSVINRDAEFVRKTLKTFMEKSEVQDGDRLFLYVMGHGVPLLGMRELVLPTRSASKDDINCADVDTCIRVKEHILSKATALVKERDVKVSIILDCCQSEYAKNLLEESNKKGNNSADLGEFRTQRATSSFAEFTKSKLPAESSFGLVTSCAVDEVSFETQLSFEGDMIGEIRRKWYSDLRIDSGAYIGNFVRSLFEASKSSEALRLIDRRARKYKQRNSSEFHKSRQRLQDVSDICRPNNQGELSVSSVVAGATVLLSASPFPQEPKELDPLSVNAVVPISSHHEIPREDQLAEIRRFSSFTNSLTNARKKELFEFIDQAERVEYGSRTASEIEYETRLHSRSKRKDHAGFAELVLLHEHKNRLLRELEAERRRLEAKYRVAVASSNESLVGAEKEVARLAISVDALTSSLNLKEIEVSDGQRAISRPLK